MKTIIHPNNENCLTPRSLKGTEFVAYATKKEVPGKQSGGYCILSRLEDGKFGFINVNRTGTAPSFVTTSIEETVTKASKDRDVRVFATSEEMLTAIVNKSF